MVMVNRSMGNEEFFKGLWVVATYRALSSTSARAKDMYPNAILLGRRYRGYIERHVNDLTGYRIHPPFSFKTEADGGTLATAYREIGDAPVKDLPTIEKEGGTIAIISRVAVLFGKRKAEVQGIQARNFGRLSTYCRGTMGKSTHQAAKPQGEGLPKESYQTRGAHPIWRGG